MQIIIDQVRNGFTIWTKKGTYVFEDGENEKQNMVGVLRFLNDLLGDTNDEYGKENVTILLAPGHKSCFWGTLPCPLCDRKPEVTP